MQKALDERIIEEKGLEGQYLLQEKFVALNTELGELANENRTWKFWREDRNPRTKTLRYPAMMDEDKVYYDAQIEEYIDVFHFLLSIGIELEFSERIAPIEPKLELDITSQFNALFYTSSHLCYSTLYIKSISNHVFGLYQLVLRLFFGLGEMMGYTWEDILNTYREKNATNHLRQAESY